jgi:hypothetical protein
LHFAKIPRSAPRKRRQTSCVSQRPLYRLLMVVGIQDLNFLLLEKPQSEDSSLLNLFERCLFVQWTCLVFVLFFFEMLHMYYVFEPAVRRKRTHSNVSLHSNPGSLLSFAGIITYLVRRQKIRNTTHRCPSPSGRIQQCQIHQGFCTDNSIWCLWFGLSPFRIISSPAHCHKRCHKR